MSAVRAAISGPDIHRTPTQKLTLSEVERATPARPSTDNPPTEHTAPPDITRPDRPPAGIVASVLHATTVLGLPLHVVAAAVEAAVLDALAGHLAPRAARPDLDFRTRRRYVDDALDRAARCPVCIAGETHSPAVGRG